MEDDIEEGSMHGQPAVVLNEARFAERIQNEIDGGPRGADHLGGRFLIDLCNGQNHIRGGLKGFSCGGKREERFFRKTEMALQ